MVVAFVAMAVDIGEGVVKNELWTQSASYITN